MCFVVCHIGRSISISISFGMKIMGVWHISVSIGISCGIGISHGIGISCGISLVHGIGIGATMQNWSLWYWYQLRYLSWSLYRHWTYHAKFESCVMKNIGVMFFEKFHVCTCAVALQKQGIWINLELGDVQYKSALSHTPYARDFQNWHC